MAAEPEDYDVERWIQAFEGDSDIFVRLREEVQYALESAVGDAGLKVHSIVSRLKSRDSYIEKISRKQYRNPLSDMHDIVAARIVCLFPGDIEKIDAVLRKTFDVVHHDDKGKESPPEMWRYLSVHYDCQISRIHQGPRYDRIKNRIFEVQVRTILQDAWANVEHYLAYKGASSIPTELKRDFSALVGLFHIADKSFQQIYDASQTLDKQASREVAAVDNVQRPGQRASVERKAIDRSTLKALCRQLYSDRRDSTDGAYSELVEDLADVGIRQINELQDLLVNGRTEAESREKKYLQNRKGFDPLTDIGLARLSISIVMPEFREMLQGKLKRASSPGQPA